MLVKAMASLMNPQLTVKQNNQVSMWIQETKIIRSKIKGNKTAQAPDDKKKIKAQKNDVSLYWG